MDTNILNPKALFQKDVRYTIPEFQRSYVWNQEDQWDPLWNDVRNVAEEYLEELERSGSDSVKAEQQTKPHFLGAIVLQQHQQVPTPAKDIEQREVIDGQQRVTTLQLLLDAIQEICEELELKSNATFLSKLVTNDKDLVGDESHHIFKLWPSSIGNDRDAFRHAMDNGLDIDDFEGSRIVEAHEFFRNQARDWLKAKGSQSDRADALATAVTAMLQMVVIDLDASVDPHVIFETLNARGTQLEESELIKNFALSQHHEESNGKGGIWEGLDDAWWHDQVSQGRLNRRRLDMLFNYWLAMRTGLEVSPLRVFKEFRSHASKQGIDAVMKAAKRDLANYRRFETGPRIPEEDQFYYRIGVMQVGVITPVLLLLLSSEHKARIRAFNALESFLVRRMICRQTTKDYNRLTLELASRLSHRRLVQKSGLEEADKIVVNFLKEQTAPSREWTTNETLAASIGSLPLYRLLTRGRLRLVLEGIETQQRSEKKAEQPDVPKNLTIEHLMPVSWEETIGHFRAATIESRLSKTEMASYTRSAISPW